MRKHNNKQSDKKESDPSQWLKSRGKKKLETIARKSNIDEIWAQKERGKETKKKKKIPPTTTNY